MGMGGVYVSMCGFGFFSIARNKLKAPENKKLKIEKLNNDFCIYKMNDDDTTSPFF